MLKKKNGQALVEAMLILPITLTVLSLLVAVLIFGTTKLVLGHWTYETAICLLEKNPVFLCERGLKKKLDMLPVSSKKLVRYRTEEAFVFVQLDFHKVKLSSQENLSQAAIEKVSRSFR